MFAKLRYIIFIHILLNQLIVSGNNTKIDSLKLLILHDKADTTKARHLSDLAYQFRNSFPDSTIYYASQSIQLCESFSKKSGLKLWRGYADAIGNLGIGYRLKGDYPKAKENYFKALEIDKKLGWGFGKGKRLVGISNLYLNIGDLPKALELGFMALEENKKINNQRAIALSNGIIGNVYAALGNYPAALSFNFKALKTFQDLRDNNNIEASLTQIGEIFRMNNKPDSALKFLENALLVADKNNLIQEKAETLNEIGITYFDIQEYEKAAFYFKSALKINTEHHIIGGLSMNYYYLGSISLFGNKFADAEKYLASALLINVKNSAISNQYMVHKRLGELFEKRKQAEKSLYHYKIYFALKDSVFNSMNNQKIQVLEFERKMAEVNLIQNEKDKKTAREISMQKTMRNTFVAGFIFMLFVAGMSYRNFRIKQKDNQLIKNQNQIVLSQKQEITDSIQYAQRIQQAILPTKESILKAFPNSFVLFKPKDIVSGDFYWFHEIAHKKYIAVCDCTGHGVPGALMSMVSTDMLNESILYTKDISEILMFTNRSIKKALKQKSNEESTRDGMDIALCCFNEEMNELSFAGAYRPLYVIRSGTNEITEIKGTKASIGGFTEDEQPFEKHSVTLKKGDTIYLSSDGFADQFNASDKKLMTKRFKEILLNVQHLSMPEQKKYLDQFITEWRGITEQTDDILVIGVRM